jgi:integrase/recombinase XerD
MQSIYTRIKYIGGWRYKRVETGRGRKTSQLEPPFFIRPFRQGKQIWHKLGAQTFDAAVTEADAVDVGLKAQAQGLTVTELKDLKGGQSVRAAVDHYLAESKKINKRKTFMGDQRSLLQFAESTDVRYLDELRNPEKAKHTLCRFRDHLAEEGFSPRTIHNRVLTVLSLLKEHKIESGFSLSNDLAEYEEDSPVPFSDEELKTLFAKMDAEEKVRYRFFLGTACREQEVTYASWSDINFEKMEYHVRRKDDVKFTPKNHESRTIPMPANLVALLKERRKNPPHSRWLFVNRDGKPEGHFLKKFKRIARDAGLNCGECWAEVTKGRYHKKYKIKVSCKTDPVCEHFFLHRFRKTCASRWEAAGIPVRTIQVWLGHKNLNTTQKYLGVTDSSKLRSNIDKAYGD